MNKQNKHIIFKTSSISGITAFALAMILGITSLPSVTNILTWKEFGFVQSKLGWLSLCCGTAHDLFNGYNMDVGWDYFLGVKCNFFLHGGLVSFHKIYFTLLKKEIEKVVGMP